MFLLVFSYSFAMRACAYVVAYDAIVLGHLSKLLGMEWLREQSRSLWVCRGCFRLLFWGRGGVSKCDFSLPLILGELMV